MPALGTPELRQRIPRRGVDQLPMDGEAQRREAYSRRVISSHAVRQDRFNSRVFWQESLEQNGLLQSRSGKRKISPLIEKGVLNDWCSEKENV